MRRHLIKYLLVPLSTLLILFAGGCGYTSSDECNLREAQKCSTDACLIRALVYCEDHQGKQYSKAFRDVDLKRKKCNAERTHISWSPEGRKAFNECMTRGN